MKFEPKTEEDLQRENLVEEGEYPFTVIEVKDKEDKNGCPFFGIKLNLHLPDGVWGSYDNLSPVWMKHKLRHFCFSVGIGNLYEAGTLERMDILDKQGICKIVVKKDKQSGELRNEVSDYVVATAPAKFTPAKFTPASVTTTTANPVDDVPF